MGKQILVIPEEQGLEEFYIQCKTCGYVDEFSYGEYATFINGKEWYWHYNTPTDEVIIIDAEIKEETEIAKKIWNNTNDR